MWTLGLVFACTMLVVALALVRARQGARLRGLAEKVSAEIEPYLRRKGAEAGITTEVPTWTSRTPEEQIVGYSAMLAMKLLERERHGMVDPVTRDLALAKTASMHELSDAVPTDPIKKPHKP
ncbi:MAG: hypothetical protein HY698_07270 [Deltaproteobacteria bacterium]|nr:hypothetical protein [Deltaproteobacteria bacterium]